MGSAGQPIQQRLRIRIRELRTKTMSRRGRARQHCTLFCFKNTLRLVMMSPNVFSCERGLELVLFSRKVICQLQPIHTRQTVREDHDHVCDFGWSSTWSYKNSWSNTSNTSACREIPGRLLQGSEGSPAVTPLEPRKRFI